MAGLKFSDDLFVKNNVPLRFWLRPSRIKERIRKLIENGGGEVVTKMASGVIRLSEPNSKVLSEDAVSTRYINDCVQSDSLLDMSTYKINPDVEISDFSDVENPPVVITHRVRRSAHSYLRSEEEAILTWICNHRRFFEVKGRKLWELMEQKEVVKNRTWQSMKEHFIKKILPNLEHFKQVITPYQIKQFDMTFSNEQDSSSEVIESDEELEQKQLSSRIQMSDLSAQDKSYKYKEDVEIIDYILKSDPKLSVRGVSIWKMMEKQNVTKHSWQSMKERFLKRILRDLTQYSLRSSERSQLLKRAGKPSNYSEPVPSSSSQSQSKQKKNPLSRSRITSLFKTFDSAEETSSSPSIITRPSSRSPLKPQLSRRTSPRKQPPKNETDDTTADEFYDTIDDNPLPKIKRFRKRLSDSQSSSPNLLHKNEVQNFVSTVKEYVDLSTSCSSPEIRPQNIDDDEEIIKDEISKNTQSSSADDFSQELAGSDDDQSGIGMFVRAIHGSSSDSDSTTTLPQKNQDEKLFRDILSKSLTPSQIMDDTLPDLKMLRDDSSSSSDTDYLNDDYSLISAQFTNGLAHSSSEEDNQSVEKRATRSSNQPINLRKLRKRPNHI